MNKLAKGALATGLGVALLIGGGGTLAVWNAEQNVAPGKIVSGDLQLTAGKGTWTNANGTINIDTYRAVPGDKLTFTQDVEVDLKGDLMLANLTVTDKLLSDASYLKVGETTLKKGATPVATALDETADGTYTAAVTVDFLSTATTGADTENPLGKIGFKLDQIAP